MNETSDATNRFEQLLYSIRLQFGCDANTAFHFCNVHCEYFDIDLQISSTSRMTCPLLIDQQRSVYLPAS